ncbi:hypothetical protein WH188_26050, partial [Sphingobacterium sp. MYb388]
MKKIEHQHAKKGGKFTFRKVILYLFLFWLGSTAVSFLFISGSKIPDRLVGLLFIGAVCFVVWKLVKRFRSAKIPSSLSNFIPAPNQEQALNLKLNNSVDIENPYAGVFISGGAGAGKSKSIVEPIIQDAGRKGFTGVVYDFKFPELAQYVNTAYQNSNVKPYFINFSDLSRSNRINPIAPELMINDSFAREFAYSILANLNPSMI